jgi:hypothetical protein
VEAFNRGDKDAFAATLSQDSVLAFHASRRICRGPEAISDAFWGQRDSTSGGQWDVSSSFTDGVHVTLEFIRKYDSSRLDIEIAVPECAIYTVRGGRIAGIKHYSDRMTELIQLGALPTTGAFDDVLLTGTPTPTARETRATGTRRLTLRLNRHSSA